MYSVHKSELSKIVKDLSFSVGVRTYAGSSKCWQ
jgi:hypothetical protein